MKWLKKFDERQQKEIEFCRIYANRFSHGTIGHNSMVIIAKMAELLSAVENALTEDNYDEEIAPAAREVLGIDDED